jgi:uncharacterized protein YfbU (UPF0304 family)
MEMNENFVEQTENVEQTTEQTPKTYTQEEVDAMMGKRVARTEAKIRKEYERKYGDLEEVLKAGTGKDNVEEMTDTFRQFYEKKGIQISKKPNYSDEDIRVLAQADADEFIRGGYEDVVEEVVVPVKQPRKFEAMEGVMCRSIVDGVLVMGGIKSNNFYKWADTNDVAEVEYQDLVSAVRSNTKYVFAPFFIIEDEDFLAQFPQVQKVYDSMYTTKDLKEILSLPVNAMMDAINALPNGSKDNLRDIAGKMVLNGQLDSVQKIKALDEFYNTNFLVTTNMF